MLLRKSIFFWIFCLFFPITGMSSQKQVVKIAPYAAGTTPLDKDLSIRQANALIDPNHYSKCGQDCLLEKAIENLSMQLLYIEQKRENLNVLIPPPTPNPNVTPSPSSLDIQTAKDLLGPYCATPEPVVDCKSRYMTLSDFWILKLRTALRNNYKSIALLHQQAPSVQPGKLLPPDGTPEPPLLPQVTYVLKSTDFKKTGLNAIQDTSAYQFAEPELFNNCKAQPLSCYEPHEDDFIQFKKIQDPTDPRKTLDVPNCDENGQKCTYDTRAFENAKAVWQKYGGNAQFQTDIQTVSGGEKLSVALKKQKKAALDAWDSHPSTAESNRPLTQQLYDGSRATYVNEINQENLSQLDRAGGSKAQISFSGPSAQNQNSAPLTGNEEIYMAPQEQRSDSNVIIRSEHAVHIGPNQIGFKSSTSAAPPTTSQVDIPYLILDDF